MGTGEQTCAACGVRAPAETMVEVDTEHYQCETCHERRLQDALIPERAPTEDDSITRPIGGDPDEAAHRHGTAA
ncbi:hypothetical protein [Streptomyces scopuliridis]|uniref:hypothetical protein n=1 Tax=Streptomyces scopuliridis TaxID=452529 RepID=UPI003427E253